MIEGVTYINDFIFADQELFVYLEQHEEWDIRVKARKTASYGVAYNYSQMNYPYRKMLPELTKICDSVNMVIGFEPNNCLINYYPNGESKMGFHADQTDILEDGTGVVIVSLGATRTLRFRNIQDNETLIDYSLATGSLLYMKQSVQRVWQHAIPKSNNNEARISLTLRRILESK
ncbi:alkylated DNA repair dioxygenase AlkB [Mucilaginibacter sp. UYNi724]